MSMAEFGFCNMTYGAQSARHEWRESQARKSERREETEAEAAASERARAEEAAAAEKRRVEEEEEERKRKEEEEERKKRKEEEERNKPWWARYEYMRQKVHRRVHQICCSQQARFHSDSMLLLFRPILPLQPLLRTLVCILPGALFGTDNRGSPHVQLPHDHKQDEMCP